MLDSVKVSWLITLLYAVFAILVALTLDGTGDSGDSIMHYLFAKFAFQHPEHFFNHWAKPLYVLVAAPFAQFGFAGVKIMNVLFMTAVVFISCRTAAALKLKNSVLAGIFFIFSPLAFKLTFSGLTEPMFAFFVAISVYLVSTKKEFAAALFISFLPFVRSEGLIFIGAFAVYFLWNRHFKALPMLLMGHLVYSIAGVFHHNNLLWVFSKIPYARPDSAYGQGDLWRFVEQLLYAVGVPLYILLWIGTLYLLFRVIRYREIGTIKTLLIIGSFWAFVIAHSLFWYFGIFNSMGLVRVLVGVIPLSALIALEGFNLLTDFALAKYKMGRQALQILLIAYILFFPFSANPGAVQVKRDLLLQEDQNLLLAANDFIKEKWPQQRRFAFSHPYLGMLLPIDIFNEKEHIPLNSTTWESGDILIWDSWFCVVESMLKRETLEQDPHWEQVFVKKYENAEYTIAVYRRK